MVGHQRRLHPPLPPEFRLLLPLVGIFTGLLGWAITNPLLTVSEWSLAGFREAQRRLEETQEQRLILKQTEEDLLKANRELARLSDRLKALQRVAEEAARPRRSSSPTSATNCAHRST